MYCIYFVGVKSKDDRYSWKIFMVCMAEGINVRV